MTALQRMYSKWKSPIGLGAKDWSPIAQTAIMLDLAKALDETFNHQYNDTEVLNLIREAFKATGRDIRVEMKDTNSNPFLVFDGDDLNTWFEKHKKK